MKSLDKIDRLCDNHLVGNEVFSYNGNETEMTMLEYWRWHFSEIFNLQDTIAEYIVAKALGLTHAYNSGDWTLFDIEYRGARIEVKESSYMHAWQTDEEPKSKSRNFGITKAYEKYKDNTSSLARQNDIYVFCLNTGNTREASNPLQLEHWEFYIVPTAVINEQCGDAKSISLSRLRKITNAVTYPEIMGTVDSIIDSNFKSKRGLPARDHK